MSPPSILDAVERGTRSSLFDTIGEEALLQVVLWASCLCSFTGKNRVPPPEHMFDVNGPFFSVMGKMYSRLMVSDYYYVGDTVRDSVREPFLISSSLTQRVDIFDCLGSKLKCIRFSLQRKTVKFDHLVQSMLRHCRDLKSLKFCVIEVTSSCTSLGYQLCAQPRRDTQ